MSREEFSHYLERNGEAREVFTDVARGSRDRIVWPLVSIPKGVVAVYPEFLVFLTDDERGAASRVLAFSAAGLAARVVPLLDKIEWVARRLGDESFDRVKALNNSQSFFVPLREVESARPFWRATHGGIVHVRTRGAQDFYIYQDMHSTGTWRYFAGGGWRWQKRLARAVMDAQSDH